MPRPSIEVVIYVDILHGVDVGVDVACISHQCGDVGHDRPRIGVGNRQRRPTISLAAANRPIRVEGLIELLCLITAWGYHPVRDRIQLADRIRVCRPSDGAVIGAIRGVLEVVVVLRGPKIPPDSREHLVGIGLVEAGLRGITKRLVDAA